jgi:hypothetical protein
MTTDNFNPPNSIWPNGLKKDEEGYVTFYPLGTNKIEVPTSTAQWPKGNRFVSPFVYQDDKLVGFIDTKAFTTDSQTTIYLPYTHIEADFSEIEKGQLQIHAPNATIKKASWKDSGKEDIPNIYFKYKGRKTLADVKKANSSYYRDYVDGVWSEPLWDLVDVGVNYQPDAMFNNRLDLYEFNADLPNLINAGCMFVKCSLKSFSNDLSSLEEGYNMFVNCNKLSSFTSELPNLTNGYNMFYKTNLTSFNIDLPKMTDGGYMFYECSNFTSFTGDLSSLMYGNSMFYGTNLKSFSCKLPNLTNGADMFRNTNITSWNIELPKMTCGSAMFWGTKLTSFNIELPNMTNGSNMFRECTKLKSFNTNLSNLPDGWWMFYNCTSFTSFNSDLSSLTRGDNMFYNCKLDTASVQNIADTINTYNGTIHIGIGNTTPNTQEKAAFNTIASKGWTVYVNGSSSSNKWNPTSLAPENGEETVTPIPFWAKPVQTDEEHAQYVDEQGNFFNILGGQFIYGDDISTYGMFVSEEDAAANMRLTPYIKPQTEIENQ